MPYLYESRRTSATTAEGQYSFRTGKRAVRSRSSGTSNLKAFKPGDDMSGWIKDRNRYISELSSIAADSPKYNGANLATDSGHERITHKVNVGRGSGMVRDNRTGIITNGNAVIMAFNAHSAAHSLNRGLETAKLADPWGHLGVFRSAYGDPTCFEADANQRDISDSYNSMIPDKAFAGWGETVVSLLRGQIPKVTSDLAKRIAKGKDLDPRATGKDLGSDYLNARFGIEPIVRDFLSTIEHLFGVQSMLFASYPRKRSTPKREMSFTPYSQRFPSIHLQTPNRKDVLGQYTPKPSDGLRGHGYIDSRISARFVRSAPTVASNSFLDQASDLHQLGLNAKLAWDLLPWSWLIDWSGNIGKSIENAEAFSPTGRWNNSYAWVTTQASAFAVVPALTWRVGQYEDIGRRFVTHPFIATSLIQQRSQGSPFGLDFKIPSMSAYQWSILVALGLARK